MARGLGLILKIHFAHLIPARLIRVLAITFKTYLAHRIRAPGARGLGMILKTYLAHRIWTTVVGGREIILKTHLAPARLIRELLMTLKTYLPHRGMSRRGQRSRNDLENLLGASDTSSSGRITRLNSYLAHRIRAAVAGGLGMPATPWRRSPRSWAWRGWCSPPCTTAGKRGLTNRHGGHLAALIRHGQIYGFCVYLSETIQKPNIYTTVILPQKNTHVTFL